MIKIDSLIPTQAGLRNLEKMVSMADAVRDGKFFNDSKPIDLSRFEDGQIYVHNGHHRVVACLMGERVELIEDEYRITEWKYARYLEINFDVHFVTPFDPVTEVRKANFKGFWEAVANVQMHQGEDEARLFIHRHRYLYCQPRNVWSVRDVMTRARVVLGGGYDPDFSPFMQPVYKSNI
jgi:hypothetical protein